MIYHCTLGHVISLGIVRLCSTMVSQ